jgi:hypothetical protein
MEIKMNVEIPEYNGCQINRERHWYEMLVVGYCTTCRHKISEPTKVKAGYEDIVGDFKKISVRKLYCAKCGDNMLDAGQTEANLCGHCARDL